MTKQRVLVIGATGMLGGAVHHRLSAGDFDVIAASRSRGLLFDAEVDSAKLLFEAADLRPGDYVINCVGLTKTHIDEHRLETIQRAMMLNVLFPISLARAADDLNVRVIQVATDCVFSGSRGNYVESSSHDAHDVYGKSKSIGEVKSENVMHLRCSLVGPESSGRKSLLFEWVRAAAPNSQLNGYVNHNWNGLTSQAFASVVAGIIESDLFLPGVHHLVPADALNKYDLVRLELELLVREDVQVQAFEAEQSIDRTLATNAPDTNRLFFASAGYERVPTIREMMEELPWGALRER